MKKTANQINVGYARLRLPDTKPFSVAAKSAGIELIRILELIPEADRIDALAIAVKVYTEDSPIIENLRKTVREMNE